MNIEDFILTSISIAVGIIGGAYASLRVQRKMKNDEKKEIVTNVKNAIKQEIQGNVDTIKREDLSLDKSDGWKSVSMKYLQIPSYESSVKSGNFILLNDELRKKISGLYTNIHIANNQADQLSKSTFTITENTAKFDRMFKKQLGFLKKKHEEILTTSNSILEKL